MEIFRSLKTLFIIISTVIITIYTMTMTFVAIICGVPLFVSDEKDFKTFITRTLKKIFK